MEMSFRKTKDYVLCVDSDGTVMDTMNGKHTRCFAPLAADMWHIENEERFFTIWNEINLFSKTRGVNRFKGLVYALHEVKKYELQLEDFSYIVNWVETAASLSNSTLAEAVKNESEHSAAYRQLSKALLWSNSANECIHAFEQHCESFVGVSDALAEAVKNAHIVVVSSANTQALEFEWKQHDLFQFTDMIYGQEAGSKVFCIQQILSYGFDPSKVLMIGDAYGDMKAAEAAGVLFFPVLFGKEPQSWIEFQHNALPKLLNGDYEKDYHQAMKNAFLMHTGF